MRILYTVMILLLVPTNTFAVLPYFRCGNETYVSNMKPREVFVYQTDVARTEVYLFDDGIILADRCVINSKRRLRPGKVMQKARLEFPICNSYLHSVIRDVIFNRDYNKNPIGMSIYDTYDFIRLILETYGKLIKC